MTIDVENAATYPCIGRCDEPAPPHTRIWFAPWFIMFTGEGFKVETPAVHYVRDGVKVTRTNVRKDTQHIYVLTDEYDELGCRLGVWPD